MPNLRIAAVLSTDPTVRVRLRAALVQKALAFMNAPKPTADPALTQWKRRREIASRALTSPEMLLDSIVWLVGNDFAVIAAATAKTPEGNVADVDDATLEAALQSALGTAVTLNYRASDDTATTAPAPVI